MDLPTVFKVRLKPLNTAITLLSLLNVEKDVDEQSYDVLRNDPPPEKKIKDKYTKHIQTCLLLVQRIVVVHQEGMERVSLSDD